MIKRPYGPASIPRKKIRLERRDQGWELDQGGRKRDLRRVSGSCGGCVGMNTRNCPALIRTFIKPDGHHAVDEFAGTSKPELEVAIHTWPDATLGEVFELVRQQSSLEVATPVSFALVYPGVPSPELARDP